MEIKELGNIYVIDHVIYPMMGNEQAEELRKRGYEVKKIEEMPTGEKMIIASSQTKGEVVTVTKLD